MSASRFARAEFVITADHADGIYHSGETVKWHVEWHGDAPPSDISYNVKRGERTEVDHGTLSLSTSGADVTAKLDAPETLLLEVDAKSADGKAQKALGGAVADPEKIAVIRAKARRLRRVLGSEDQGTPTDPDESAVAADGFGE